MPNFWEKAKQTDFLDQMSLEIRFCNILHLYQRKINCRNFWKPGQKDVAYSFIAHFANIGQSKNNLCYYCLELITILCVQGVWYIHYQLLILSACHAFVGPGEARPRGSIFVGPRMGHKLDTGWQGRLCDRHVCKELTHSQGCATGQKQMRLDVLW